MQPRGRPVGTTCIVAAAMSAAPRGQVICIPPQSLLSFSQRLTPSDRVGTPHMSSWLGGDPLLTQPPSQRLCQRCAYPDSPATSRGIGVHCVRCPATPPGAPLSFVRLFLVNSPASLYHRTKSSSMFSLAFYHNLAVVSPM